MHSYEELDQAVQSTVKSQEAGLSRLTLEPWPAAEVQSRSVAQQPVVGVKTGHLQRCYVKVANGMAHSSGPVQSAGTRRPKAVLQ
jgi:hypothetical protein